MLKQSLKRARVLAVLMTVLASTAACAGPGITPAPNLVPGHQYPQDVFQGGG